MPGPVIFNPQDPNAYVDGQGRLKTEPFRIHEFPVREGDPGQLTRPSGLGANPVFTREVLRPTRPIVALRFQDLEVAKKVAARLGLELREGYALILFQDGVLLSAVLAPRSPEKGLDFGGMVFVPKDFSMGRWTGINSMAHYLGVNAARLNRHLTKVSEVVKEPSAETPAMAPGQQTPRPPVVSARVSVGFIPTRDGFDMTSLNMTTARFFHDHNLPFPLRAQILERFGMDFLTDPKVDLVGARNFLQQRGQGKAVDAIDRLLRERAEAGAREFERK